MDDDMNGAAETPDYISKSSVDTPHVQGDEVVVILLPEVIEREDDKDG